MSDQIRFVDGAAYERYMGVWSRTAGERFLDWLAPTTGWRWLDVGCGSGAFTETIVERCAPRAVAGIDPADAQLVFARTRPSLRSADLQPGNAMAIPFGDDAFDAAVMPLVIFFVPDPPVAVAEMRRVVRPGGVVAAYAWDLPGEGFPYHDLHDAIREIGMEAPLPPHPEASRLDVMQTLWTDAGLLDVETCVIEVQRTFESFDDYFSTVKGGASVAAQIAQMSPAQLERLATLLRERLPVDPAGRITCSGVANAAKGRVPAPTP